MARKSQTLYRSLIEDHYDQGDPNIVEIPEPHRRKFAFRYYAFITDDSDYGRHQHPFNTFPCYGSNDLFSWEFLEVALSTTDDATRWAPCVNYIPELERPFVMLYSKAKGKGEHSHVQHKIRRADSLLPEGPFVDSGEVLTDDFDFAIDPQIFLSADGRQRMAFATDFVSGHPIGTGLAHLGISKDLRKIDKDLVVIARASADWQMYDEKRVMQWKEIPGVDWERGDTVRWHCLEGPVAGIVGPTGRRFVFYSAGNYSSFYAIGIIEELPDGTYVDLSSGPESCLLAPDPDKSFYSVGRVGVVKDPSGQMYASYHARFGSPDAPRRLGLAPLYWNYDGLPYCKREEF
jgi:hypothetical protein